MNILLTKHDRLAMVDALEIYAIEQSGDPSLNRKIWTLATRFSEPVDVFEVKPFELVIITSALKNYMSTDYADVPQVRELLEWVTQ